MKRITVILSALFVLTTLAVAQPAKSRVNTAKKTETEKAKVQDRASLMFPTAVKTPDDVVWRRDVYRQLDLMKDKNAPLYYPVQPKGRQVNFFTYIFRLVLTGRVTAYSYSLDMNESFEEKNKMNVKEFLERYGIYYEEKDGKLTVADSDIPSAECTRYYVKEGIFLDQRTGTFSTRVEALCPVLMRGADEFSTEAATPYPMFWIKYSDAAPWFAKLPMMGSNLNNVSNQTADDYVTRTRYDGKIYKTNNLQGKILANYCPSDSALTKEQKKIEQQLKDFEEGVWGHRKLVGDSTKVDSLVAEPVKNTTRARAEQKTSSSEGSASKSAAAEAPRVSARRARR